MDLNPYAPVSAQAQAAMAAYATKEAYYDGKDYASKRLADHEDTPQSLLNCALANLRVAIGPAAIHGRRFWSGVRYVARKGLSK